MCVIRKKVENQEAEMKSVYKNDVFTFFFVFEREEQQAGTLEQMFLFFLLQSLVMTKRYNNNKTRRNFMGILRIQRKIFPNQNGKGVRLVVVESI